MELAECWEASDGFPKEVSAPLVVRFPKITPLISFPEFKVALPGGDRASQNDIWILARSEDSLVSITVEGKVNEPFDRPLTEWLARPSSGKIQRWNYLKQRLGLKREPDHNLMYQLFHRTASAIIQAEQFKADHAVMVVHSFSAEATWFREYSAFLELFGVAAARGRLQTAQKSLSIPLHFLWAKGINSVRRPFWANRAIQGVAYPAYR